MLAVAVALRPAEYDFGAEAPDGSAWEPFPDAPDSWPARGQFETNPKLLLDENDWRMVRLWGLFTKGHLPDSGGAIEQPSVMLEAFDVMEAAASRIRERSHR